MRILLLALFVSIIFSAQLTSQEEIHLLDSVVISTVEPGFPDELDIYNLKYNSDFNLSEIINYYKFEGFSDTLGAIKEVYVYDDESRNYSINIFSLDNNGDEFEERGYENYIYSNDNLQRLERYSDYQGEGIILTSYEEYQYIDDSLRSMDQYILTNNDELELDRRIFYTYNNDGLIDSIIDIAVRFNYYSVLIHEYNDENQLIELNEYYQDSEGNGSTENVYTVTYTDQGDIDEIILMEEDEFRLDYEHNTEVDVRDVKFTNLDILTESYLDRPKSNHQLKKITAYFDFGGNEVLFGSFEYYYRTEETSSTQESILTDIKLYPNPATDYVEFDAGDYTISQFELYDSQGRIILRQNMQNTSRIDLTRIPTGVYFYKVYTNEGVAQGKIIVD